MRSSLGLGLVVAVLLSAGACASTGAAGSRQGELEFVSKRQLNRYLDCLYTHADGMASGTGAAPVIADRALAHCTAQHGAYCAAANDYFTSIAAPADQAEARDRARARCLQTSEEAREGLVSRVARERELTAQRRERALAEALERSPGESAERAQ